MARLTGSLDRFLLMGTVAMLPMQANIPTFGGMGVLFFIFSGLLVYQLFVRPNALFRTAKHPVFLTGFSFVCVAILLETMHEDSAYSSIVRIGFMLVGGVILASLCRDRSALVSGMYGYILGGVVLSCLLVFTTHGRLNAMDDATGDFYEASVQRGAVFSNNPLKDDLNTMSFFAALGAIVGIALALGEKRFFRRFTLFGLSTICVVGTIIPMSRSGLGILVICLGVALYSYGVMRPQVILVVAVLAVTTLVWMPAIMWDRLAISTERLQVTDDYKDSRVEVYQASLNHLSEYVITGVGEGNFYGKWGQRSDFLQKNGAITSPHNVYARVTINWGLMALAAFLILVWQAYRCLRIGSRTDPLWPCLQALALAVFLWLQVIDTLEAKEFSLILGFLVAADLWIWPKKRLTNKVDRGARHDTGVFALRSTNQPPVDSSYP